MEWNADQIRKTLMYEVFHETMNGADPNDATRVKALLQQTLDSVSNEDLESEWHDQFMPERLSDIMSTRNWRYWRSEIMLWFWSMVVGEIPEVKKKWMSQFRLGSPHDYFMPRGMKPDFRP